MLWCAARPAAQQRYADPMWLTQAELPTPKLHGTSKIAGQHGQYLVTQQLCKACCLASVPLHVAEVEGPNLLDTEGAIVPVD